MTALRDFRSECTPIEPSAPEDVRRTLAALGRVEDVRFSPDCRRLAVAAYHRNRVAVFDVDIAGAAPGAGVRLTGVVEIASRHLSSPHGVDFLDDMTVIVANRDGDVAIFELPPSAPGSHVCASSPIQVLPAGGSGLLKSPGSVSAGVLDRRMREILVCNNAGDTVTRHRLDLDAGWRVVSSDVLIEKGLTLPDGVCVSGDRQWIAVSNHDAHQIMLFENNAALNREAEPDGILRGLHFPHGLRFVAQDALVVAADAGSPYVHVFAREDGSWRGVRSPLSSFRVMDDALFQQGRHNPQEGGPKGIDVDAGMNVLAVTSERRPLAFFDLPLVLKGVWPGEGAISMPGEAARWNRQTLQLRYEIEAARQAKAVLAEMESRNARLRAKLVAMKRSLSWRLTKPLRRAASKLGLRKWPPQSGSAF